MSQPVGPEHETLDVIDHGAPNGQGMFPLLSINLVAIRLHRPHIY
jgi:hypothetical protein